MQAQVLAGIGDAVESDPANALLGRIARGDRQAMDAFYTRFQDSVFRFALSRLGDHSVAGDILNETMLKVWLDAARFRGEARVQTWLLGITFQKTMDRMRARYRHAAEPLDPSLPDEDASDMALVLARIDDIQRVQTALAALGEPHRSVLHLAFYEDLPYAEMAKVLGCPEGTVKSRVFHAKQSLKRLLRAA